MTDPRTQLSVCEIQEYSELLLVLSDEVRGIILERVSGGLAVESKVDKSVVTSADKDAERHFRERLGVLHPGASILGEEEPFHDTGSDYLWVIDPVDGTHELVHQCPLYGSVISLYYKGAPIAAVIDHPALDTRMYAAFGQGTTRNCVPVTIEDTPYVGTGNYVSLPPLLPFLRQPEYANIWDAVAKQFPNYRTYYCCFGNSQACSGNVDAVFDFNCHLWDISASKLLIEEAGGAYAEWTHPGQNDDTLYISITGKPSIVRHMTTLINPLLATAGIAHDAR
jgi:myo-inositol-1(or 4)-monophosphatase